MASANYDIQDIFPIDGWFETIRNPNSEWMVFNSYIFINSNLSSYKNWKQN